MTPVLIALGSNLGDRAGQMGNAVKELEPWLDVQKLSELYQTVPMYQTDQPPFYNAALLALTQLPPLSLLQKLKSIESRLGRQERERYGPRELDLDILNYGSLSYIGPKLQLPHPRIHERPFVLKPLLDLCPNASINGLNSVADLVSKLPKSQTESMSIVIDQRWNDIRDTLEQRNPTPQPSKAY